MSAPVLLFLCGHAANLVIVPRPAPDGGGRGAPLGEHELRLALRDLATDPGNADRLRAFAVRHDLVRAERVALQTVFEAIVGATRGRFAAFIVSDIGLSSGRRVPRDAGGEDEDFRRTRKPGQDVVPPVLFGGVRQVGPWGDPPKPISAPPPPPAQASRAVSQQPPPRPGSSGPPAPASAKPPPSAKSQAQTRRNAAKSGAPFCEICAG